jgi:hypothetical protein
MPKNRRPTSVVVLGILNIIFGSLGLVCFVCAGIGLLVGSGLSSIGPPGAQNQPNALDQQKYMAAHITGYVAIEVTRAVIGLVVAAMLLASGIGLLKMRSWARLAGLGYSGVQVILLIAGLLYSIFVLNPVMADYYVEQAKKSPTPTPFTFSPSLFHAIAFLVFLFGFWLPLTNLIILLRSNVRAAFARAALPQDERDRYDDEDDDRPDILDKRPDPDDRIRPPEERDY